MTSEIIETPPVIPTTRGIGLSEPILLNPATVRSDARIVARAIKERWRIPEDRKDGLVDRLFSIVSKASIDVMTKFGPEAMDGPADVNAIAAARVLVAMMGQNQTDEQAPSQTNIQINVDPAKAGGVKVYLPHNFRDDVKDERLHPDNSLGPLVQISATDSERDVSHGL